jgi:threonine aldolase
MREAIATAEVGDDVYGEDPTVNRLQEKAAQLLGFEAALFVPTGTMANQASLYAHTRPGDTLLAGHDAHILRYESGAAAALSGVQIRTLGADGLFDADDVRTATPVKDPHNSPVTAVALEQTHNAAGGCLWPLEQRDAVVDAARDLGLHLHLDGARLFNAVVASGVTAQRWSRGFYTVCFCFSKGLGAPVGSIVCGSAEVIERIHRVRKMLGGGMRQAGMLAAAALFALDHHIERLAEDHANARRLAAGLRELGLAVDPEPETNIVLFQVPAAARFHAETKKRGVLINPIRPGVLRAVTHLDVSTDQIDDALQRIGESVQCC